MQYLIEMFFKRISFRVTLIHNFKHFSNNDNEKYNSVYETS